MRYQTTVETEFDGEAKCESCKFCFENDCNETWCGLLEDKQIVVFLQHDETMQGYTKRAFDTPRPTWCPLVEKK